MAGPVTAVDGDGSGETHKARGNELLKAGNFVEAAAAYGLAIKADPTVPAYWSNRSHALLRSGDAEGALRDADEVADLTPSWAKAHYRRAQALKELGRPHEAAQACADGLTVVEGEGEAKELRKLREVMSSASGALVLSGWWHGEVSKELGGFMQEFCFMPEGELKCSVYGQELPGKYVIRDVEAGSNGEVKGGVDVSLNGEKVPYLFRVDGKDGEMLHLCCPMTSPPERPRTFHGPGYVGMRKGREASAEPLSSLSEGQRVLRYLGELAEAMEARLPSDTGGDSRAADRLLEEAEGGGTVNSQQLMGQESLEDKAKKMAQEHHIQALRVKYSDAVDEIAQRIIKGETKPSEAYPEEAKALEKLLRRLSRCEDKAKEDEEEEEPPSKEPEPVAEPTALPTPSAAQPVALAPPAPQPAAEAPPAPVAEKVEQQPPKVAPPKPAEGGFCGGCFAGFRR